MLAIDASCVAEIVISGPDAQEVRERLAADDEHVAPHVIDVEVLAVIRREHRLGELDRTAATLAVQELHDWPVQRFGHRALLARAWELRDTVRGWDAMYVALAEALEATLVTTDHRLARATGPRCEIETIGPA